MRYTEHFSDETDKMIMNIAANGAPPQPVILNMQRVLDELEKARMYFGCSFTITSGYRSRARNKSIGGAKGSAHVTGEAVDFIAKGNLFAVFVYIVNKLDFDQVIYESDCKGNIWVHLAIKKAGNRKQALIATCVDGKMEYKNYVKGVKL